MFCSGNTVSTWVVILLNTFYFYLIHVLYGHVFLFFKENYVDVVLLLQFLATLLRNRGIAWGNKVCLWWQRSLAERQSSVFPGSFLHVLRNYGRKNMISGTFGLSLEYGAREYNSELQYVGKDQLLLCIKIHQLRWFRCMVIMHSACLHL